MSFKLNLSGKFLVALSTGKQEVLIVRFPMGDKSCGLGKSFTTVRANVRFLFSVDPHVSVKV